MLATMRRTAITVVPWHRRGYVTFNELALDVRLTDALAKSNIVQPTEVQKLAIKKLLNQTKQDVIIGAETGSGKTLAYALPLLHRLTQLPLDKRRGYGLVLLPSGDLVRQVGKVLEYYGQGIVSVATATRGDSLNFGPTAGVVVTTPRLLSHYNYADLLKNTQVVVLDEADLLLSGSFFDQIKPLIQHFRSQRAQFILSAATIANVGTKSIDAIVQRHFPRASYITLNSMHRPVSTVRRLFERTVNDEDKYERLLQYLNKQDPVSTLVFVRSSRRADLVANFLIDNGYSCGAYHKNVALSNRTELLEKLCTRANQVLVCTDLAARGLDVQSIRRVIEFDFALNVTDHLHRIGRTARAGMSGTVVSFISQGDEELAQAISQREHERMDALFSRNRSFRRRIQREKSGM